MQNGRLFIALLSLGLSQIYAQDITPTSAKIEKPKNAEGSFVFSLFARSMQKDPRTDITTICEMTNEGRKRPVVTKANPATYVSFDGGFLEAGYIDTNHMPNQEALLQNVERALRFNGFTRVEEGQASEYALIYHWGTHTKDPVNDTLGDIASRARLVGGNKFARELEKVLVDQAQFYQTTLAETVEEDGSVSGVSRVARDPALDALARAAKPDSLPSVFGEGSEADNQAVSMKQSMDPLQQFARRDSRTRFLLDQTFGSIYFVVISAFDAKYLAQGKKVLLWRARMSVDSTGISLSDALPSMIANSSEYLGRDMDIPATMTPKLLRGKASVELGEATVVETPTKTDSK